MSNHKQNGKRVLSLLLAFTILLTSIFIMPNVSNALTTTIDVPGNADFTDLAYYDIWKHEDGHWQNGIKQGDSVSQNYSITESLVPSGAKITKITASFDKNYNDPRYFPFCVKSGSVSSVGYQYKIGETKAGSTASVNYNVSTTLTSNTGSNGENRKEDWQSGNVEGWRYYIPVHIHIEYTTKQIVVIGDFQPDLNLPATAKQGESYTAADATTVDESTVIDHAVLQKHYGDGSWETVATWNGSGKPGENTRGSVSESCDELCTITYRLTVYDTGGQSKSVTKRIDIVDGREIDGKAILELPEYTYEGHPALAEDLSVLEVDGITYSARRAYEEGVADNYFQPLPSSAGSAVKISLTKANVTFPNAGHYNVRLEVDTATGQRLTDTKPIEVRKTPYIIDSLGGFQKENRKQILSISVATYPGRPIVDYSIKLKDMKTGQEIVLTKDQPQQNNATIKTRTVTSGGDSYWTNFELLFLTKNTEEQQYQYTVYMRDSKGDTDTVQKAFTVKPDLPPNPVIVIQDSFIRNKGTNYAEIITEDASTTDGDQLERTWSYDGKNVKTFDGYKDLSFGTGQKVQFNKYGVGKTDVELFLKDVWIEPTLEEYVTDADHKTATTIKTTDVINIAPTVKLEPINTKEIDITLLTDKKNKAQIGASINTLKAALIEKGFDPHIGLAVAADEDDGSYRKVASWTWDTTVNCQMCNQNSGQMDSDYVYRIVSPGKYVDGYQERCKTDQPHVFEALTAGSTADSGYVAWSYPVNESRSFTFYLDNKEKYVYLSCGDINQTIVLNRDNGAYLTTLPMAIPGAPFLNDDGQNLYFVGGSSITKYDTASGTYSTVMNRGGGLAQMMDGRIVFVGKKDAPVKLNKNGNGFYIGKFDMNTEMIEEIAIPELPNTTGIVSACDIDTQGKVLLRQQEKIWVADTQNQTVKMTTSGQWQDRMNSAVFVKNEKGEGVYVANAANTTDYKSNSRFYFTLFDFSSDSLNGVAGYSKSFYGYNGNGISYAKLHSKENMIYIMQGNQMQSNDWGGSVAGFLCRINVATMGIDIGYSNWGWDVADESGTYNGSLMRTFYTFDRWMSMEDRINIFRNAITEKDAKLFALRKNSSSANGESEKYVVVTGDESAEQILDSQDFKNEIDLRGARSIFHDLSNIVETIAEKIESFGDSLKNYLLLEGDRTENLASVEHEVQLKPNTDYEYVYDMMATGPAVDLFSVKNANSQGLPNDNKYFERIVAYVNFNHGISEPFFKMSGGTIYADSYFGYGYGNVSERNYTRAFSMEFTMEKEGYVSYDLYVGDSGYKENNNTVTTYINGVKIGSAGVYGRRTWQGAQKIYLSPGTYTLRFDHFADDAVSGAGSVINNVKAVYLEDTIEGFNPASVKDAEGKLQTVSGSFRVAGAEGVQVLKELSKTATTKTAIELSKYITSSSTYEVERWDSAKNRYYWQSYDGPPFTYNEATATFSIEGIYQNSYPRFAVKAPSDKFLICRYTLSYSSKTTLQGNYDGERLYPQTEYRIIRPDQAISIVASMANNKDRQSMSISDFRLAEFDADDFGGSTIMQSIPLNVHGRSVNVPLSGETDLLLFHLDESSGNISIKHLRDIDDSGMTINNGIKLSTSESAEKISALISSFSLYQKIGGVKQLIFAQKFNSQNALDLTGWRSTVVGSGKAEIVSVQPPAKEEDAPLVYKKGQLVAYNIFYDDYENDPSQKQFWRYTHTPYNDGPHPQAAFILDEDGNMVSSTGAILSESIPRFYVDGKYTVEHWQLDNTNRTGDTSGKVDYSKYDKLSNVESLTFYIEGGASAPWITSIKTIPGTVKEGSQYRLQIGVDDAEKDELRLTTELYKDKRLIYTHKQTGIVADANGNYPLITTGYPPLAEAGKYEVVCTVRDWSGAGIGSYKFTVVSEGKVTGRINHTDAWEMNRKKYNLALFDDEVNREYTYSEYMALSKPRKRGTNIFWSGEKFVLQAAVAGNPVSVTCSIDGYSYNTAMLSTGTKNGSNETIYIGALWDSDMLNKWANKDPQLLTFTFTATYSGGIIKKDNATVIIDNSVPYWQLHRYF